MSKYDPNMLASIEAEAILEAKKALAEYSPKGEYWAVLEALKLLRAVDPARAAALEERSKVTLQQAREAVWAKGVEEAKGLLEAFALLAQHAAGRLSNTGRIAANGLPYRIKAVGSDTLAIFIAGEEVARKKVPAAVATAAGYVKEK